MSMRSRSLAAGIAGAVLAACGGAVPTETTEPAPSREAFVGTLRCPHGEDEGAATWDYGSNPQGRTTNAVGWVRAHATGLDPSLKLTFLETAGPLENVVVATGEDGSAVAYVQFGQDDLGRYFPTEAGACTSSGVEGFT